MPDPCRDFMERAQAAVGDDSRLRLGGMVEDGTGHLSVTLLARPLGVLQLRATVATC